MIHKIASSDSTRAARRFTKDAPRFAVAALSGALMIALAGAPLLGSPQANAASWPAMSASAAIPSGPSGFSALVAKVKPAVVNVAVSGSLRKPRVSPGEVVPDFPEGAPLGEFFRHFFERQGIPQQDGDGPHETHGQGSGFIIDPSGYVVTSHHVVANAKEITIILDDGTRYPAQVKGQDSKTDLALLKLEPKQSLPYVQFGDSDVARAGDWVLAVGNPFGLGGTVTAGIISARGRDIQSGPFDDFLQIDAPINRGNSGGPLFDVHGQVIGVNSAIYSPTGGNVGIGFAIPASLAKPVVDQLKASGSIERGWLGVQIQPVTAKVAESLGIEPKKGALVASVLPDSPAARTGVRPGDVILGLGGERLDDFKDLPWLVAGREIGKETALVVYRQGAKQTLQVRIGRMPGEDMQASVTRGDTGHASQQLGIHLGELTTQARKRYQLPDDAEGVLVMDVDKGSPAARAGIQPGNLISMVGQEPVATPEELVQMVRKASSARRPSVLLLVESGGERRFVPVKLAA